MLGIHFIAAIFYCMALLIECVKCAKGENERSPNLRGKIYAPQRSPKLNAPLIVGEVKCSQRNVGN